MKTRRIARVVAISAAVALVAGAFAAPAAQAGKKKLKCAKFAPVAPTTDSGMAEDATTAPVAKLTSKYTEEKPLVIEYHHGAALWETVTQTPIQEDTQFFNFQIYSGTPETGLHIKMEWANPSPSDIDMYLYDATGARYSSSGAFNPAAVPGVFDAGGNGGNGYESIPGALVTQCAGYTVESRAFMTAGEDVTLTVWLGEVGDNIQE